MMKIRQNKKKTAIPFLGFFAVFLGIFWVEITAGDRPVLASGFQGGLTASQEPEVPVPERFDTLRVLFHAGPGVPFIGFLVAQNEGYYADEGLPPVEFTHITPAQSGNRELRAGRFQFHTTWTAHSVRCAALGDDCVSIAQTLRCSSSGFVVRSDIHPDILSIDDLAKRRIGIFFRGWEDATAVLRSQGIEFESVNYLETGLNLLRRDAICAICYCSYGAENITEEIEISKPPPVFPICRRGIRHSGRLRYLFEIFSF